MKCSQTRNTSVFDGSMQAVSWLGSLPRQPDIVQITEDVQTLAYARHKIHSISVLGYS